MAAETGFSRSTVSTYLRRAGIRSVKVGFITQYHIDRKELVKLTQQGVSSRHIAKQYRCSMTTVERAL